MPVFNLPPLGKQGLTEARDIGRWVPIQSLDGLAKALRLDDRPVRPEDLKSIPDAWAQVQLTAEALLDRSHEAHEEARSLWRGILALFALQPTYAAEYTLAVHAVPITGTKDNASRLKEVLRKLVPTSTAARDVDWSQVGIVDVVEAGGATLKSAAMLSPATLVAPGRMASSLRLPVPWASEGPRDPLLSSDLPPHAWRILTAFLEGLLARLRGLAASTQGTDVREPLILQVDEYREECAARAPQNLPIAARTLHEDWPQPAFFGMLGETFVSEGGGSVETSLQLAGAGADALFDGAILIDPALADSLRKPATNIVAWHQHTLSQALVPATFQRIKEEAERKGFLVLQPTDFFTEKLVRLGSEAHVTAHPAELRGYLLPFAPATLLFFADVDELAASVSLRDRGNGIEVALSLALHSPDGEERRHTIRRIYEKGMVVDLAPPEDLALWPDFESDDWPWTFMRFQYDPRSELQTRFAASSQLISADLAGEDRRGRLTRFAQWASPNRLDVETRLSADRLSTLHGPGGKRMLRRVRFAQGPNLIGEHHRLLVPVQAICFALRQGSRGADTPVGIALVKRARAEAGGGEATVSIDFGTTNTIAYARVGTRAPERLAIKDRVVFPIEYSRNEDELAAEYTDFFNLQDHQTPVPTVAKLHKLTGALGEALRRCVEEGSPDIGETHQIFFTPALNREIAPQMLMKFISENSLLFDLKWGGDPKNNKVVQVFLQELMILAGAELADRGVPISRINWRFSHPQAFTRTQLGTFQAIVAASREQILREVPAHGGGGGTLALMTEGEAAAAYFSGDEEQRMRGITRLFITLDIGGGTTDLAIRLDDALVWRGSVRVAGSHFFRRYLVNNPGVLKVVDPKAWRQLSAAAAADAQSGLQGTTHGEQLVDLIVARPNFAQDFADAYPLHHSDEAWAGLRHCATTALGGILHYVGLVLRLLVVSEVLREDDLDDEITVALGGRGSSFFRLLNVGIDPTPLSRLCRVIAVAAGRDSASITFLPQFSKGPKEEVARGLLLERQRPPQGRQVSLLRPSGLDVDATILGNRVTVPWNDSLDDILQATEATDVDAGQLVGFLSQLRAQTGLGITLSPDAKGNIERLTRQQLAAELRGLSAEDRAEADSQALEAPFVTALRLLVGQLSDEPGRRASLLSVRESE